MEIQVIYDTGAPEFIFMIIFPGYLSPEPLKANEMWENKMFIYLTLKFMTNITI